MSAVTYGAFTVLMIVAVASDSTILDSRIEISQFGKSLTINCTHENVTNNHKILLKYWVLPADMSIVEPRVKTNNSNVELLDNGWSLHIAKVEPEDLGTYLCLTVSTNRGHYYEYSRVKVYRTEPETWDQFRQNTITAAIAAGATFVLIVCVCIIYNCRWQPAPGQRKVDHMKQSLYNIEYSYEPESPTVTSIM